MNPVLQSLPILVLYPHSRCNCRCVMCDIWKTEKAEEIGPEELNRHLDDIEHLRVEWIVFSGGEPLMHSDLFRLSTAARARGIRTTLLSTGLLLSRYSRRIAESIDDVIVSLDGPADVHDAIRRVAGAYTQMSLGVSSLGPAFPVSARCTVQRGNFTRLRETVAAARALQLRSISFLAADLHSTAFNRPEGWPPDRQAMVAPPLEEISRLEFEVEALIDQEDGQGFVVETPDRLRRIVRHFRAYHGITGEVAPRCNAPWVSSVLESDGTVRPCFFHPPIGNAKTEGLAAVLNGPRAIAFRSALRIEENPVCRRCVCSLYRPPAQTADEAGTTNT